VTRERDLAARTYPEAGSALKRRAVALLPIGSTEPHGPHLPLDTDVIISVEAARRAAARLARRGIDALVLPPLAYTIAEFSRGFPGAISVSAETTRALLSDICASAAAQGFAAICFVNSHLEPDHLAALREAATLGTAATGRPVVFPDKTQRRWSATLTPEFRSGACHAGRYETSLVMAAAPEAVREAQRVELPPVAISIGRKIKEGARTFLEAGGDQAYFGDPGAATIAEGDSTYEALASMVETEVVEALAQT
jgi:creatinine amidohydrolase